jgi:hypothetical protein
MMAKGTFASLLPATPDLDATFEQVQATEAEIVQEPTVALQRSRLRSPRPRGQHDPHPGAVLICTEEVVRNG